MKITIITPNFPPEKVTGAERFSYKLSCHLSNVKDKKIIILTNKNYKFKRFVCQKILFETKKIKRKLFRDYFNNKAYTSSKLKVDRFNPDVIHINNFYGIGSNTLKRLSQEYPLLITVHDYFPICYSATLFKENAKNKGPCICYPPLGWIHKMLMHQHLRDIQLISPSEFLAKKLRDNGFEKAKVIHNGVDIPKQTTNYKKNILFVGRLSPEKGLQTIISTLNKVRDYNVLILGEGPLKKELEAKYKNIKFLGFQNPNKYYKEASISIVPSIWEEPFGLVVGEAMSYGLCVIGSNIGGIPEQIKHRETGLLFEPGNEKDFKEKLDYLLKNSKEIKRIGKNARAFVKKNFDWKKIVKQYEQVYKQVIDELIDEFKKKHEKP
ncbi:MAG: glycosyltransferase family 4 protein [Candidatus Omnitrophota bacterium]|nr:glycosyltransferase family 4 protein [Candidatus Omnitrophota bacterium]